MPLKTTPPFRADHVGSLLRPPELLAAREARKQERMTAAELREVEDRCIREAVKLQQELGFQAVTDGEFRRTWWHLDFLERFQNVTVVPPSVKAKFHRAEGDIEVMPPGIRVTGKLARPSAIMREDFNFLKSIAQVTPKVTIPSPSTMHFRGGRRAIDERAYPELAGFYADLGRIYAEEVADLAQAGCTYLQIDEVNLAYLCDPKLRDQVRLIGENPETLPATYAHLINAAIATRPPAMTICMHLCRGNFQSAWVAEGGYEPVAEILFNQINVDGYFLEYDDPRSGDFSPLRFVPRGKTVVLGLVSSKTRALETVDELARRIDQAARFVPLDQLALSPQCGFSSTVEGNLVSLDDEIAKLRLVVETARRVWRD
ncbi:MAG TPA: 5-methyltetrahydropteroyltriglutamate--homocysteine S-methyltransferase [Candidatus Binataceae bacterium]|nr:5-methyltetrahydropteroyltriglutamate--homocysteine S-methyltransferase [Candidatus Binataceae bacterium]HVB81729.1 5-methyltetrahydropteroyltriglutamate--homocysteine S-methyltransferase [Candidatus Binataceae bacterium]